MISIDDNKILIKSMIKDIIKPTFNSSIVFLLEFIFGLFCLTIWLWIKEESIFFAFLTFFTPLIYFNVFETTLVPIFFIILSVEEGISFLLEKSYYLLIASIVIFCVLYSGLFIFKEIFQYLSHYGILHLTTLANLTSGSFNLFSYFTYIIIFFGIIAMVNFFKKMF